MKKIEEINKYVLKIKSICLDIHENSYLQMLPIDFPSSLRQREQEHIHRFILHVPITARDGPGWRQKPEAQWKPPT